MTTAESRRHDLYNALSEFLGAERADTLMAYLPSENASELATRADINATRADMDRRFDLVDDRLNGVEQRLERLEHGIATANQRLDRLFLTLVASLLGVLVAVFAQALS